MQEYPVGERDLAQSFVFTGTVVGYLALHFAGSKIDYNPIKLPTLATLSVLMLLLPAAALASCCGVHTPIYLLWVVNLITGMAGAFATVLWLDICSRLGNRGEYRFCSFSLFFGGVLFILVIFMPKTVQVAFSAIYCIGSMALVKFTSSSAPLNNVMPELSAGRGKWAFALEIEPSMLCFGIVFALNFVYLFNFGGMTLAIGLMFAIPGAAAVALLATVGREVGITLMQRILLCVTVLSCVATPFVPSELQILTVGLVVMSWAALISVNYAMLVRKSKNPWACPVFRQVPLRLVFSALGFCIGWIIAAVVGIVFGAHSEIFGYVRLGMAVVLVVVFMVFLPDIHHHEEDAIEELSKGTAPRVIPVGFSENDLFEARCLAAAKMYKLSPRETDVLGYLARGRNAAYLQEKLCISPHTVKSHIYSIYRKFDIHSQQKLMDFIEEYPLSDEDMAKLAEKSKG